MLQIIHTAYSFILFLGHVYLLLQIIIQFQYNSTHFPSFVTSSLPKIKLFLSYHQYCRKRQNTGNSAHIIPYQFHILLVDSCLLYSRSLFLVLYPVTKATSTTVRSVTVELQKHTGFVAFITGQFFKLGQSYLPPTKRHPICIPACNFMHFPPILLKQQSLPWLYCQKNKHF